MQQALAKDERIPMPHPYADLPDTAFWKTGVEKADRQRFPGLYEPRLRLTKDVPVATAGSCFAQHIGTWLRAAGCRLLDAEPAPRAMSDVLARRFGYGLFSGRYGNIYTARQLRQFLEEVADGEADPRHVWENDGAFRDGFRPTVEPDGLGSVAEVLLHRDYHLERTSRMLRQAELFIFTLGLTEAWEDAETGRVYPLCPGVAGGTFDAERHRFRNFRHAEIIEDLHAIRALLHRFNPDMSLLLTVSPVPLTATASGNHVLAATSWSKATLRAAAGDFVAETDRTDYFPSLELVTQPASGGPWFAPNMREVSEAGVARVMSVFFEAHGLTDLIGTARDTRDNEDDSDRETEPYCDEILLQAFAT